MRKEGAMSVAEEQGRLLRALKAYQRKREGRQDSFAAIGEPPTGFFMLPSEPGALALLHRRAGMRQMNAFLAVWLLVWTLCCAFLLREVFFSGHALKAAQVFFAAVFCVSEAGVACLLFYLLFSRKLFYLDSCELFMETRLLFMKWRKTFPRNGIASVRQVKDGGEGKDSFPSWGLKLFLMDGSSKTLLCRLPYEQSQWLGGVIGRWSGAGFDEAPPP